MDRRVAIGAGLLLALCLTLTAAPVAAELRPPPVHLVSTVCPGLDLPELRRLLMLELGSPLAPRAGPGVARVTLTCETGGVVVRIDDPLTRKTLLRQLPRTEPAAEPPPAPVAATSAGPVAAAAEHDPRLVALAVVELLRASWAELLLRPTAAAPAAASPAPEDPALQQARQRARALAEVRLRPPQAAPARALAEAPARPRRAAPAEPAPRPAAWSWQIGAEGRGLTYFTGLGVLAGGGATVMRVLPHRLRVGLEAFALGGVGRTASTETRATALLASAVVQMELDLSPYNSVILGAGWQVGAAEVAEVAEGRSSRGYGVVTGPEARVRLGVQLAPPVWLTLGVGGGGLLASVGQGRGAARVALEGGWLDFGIGLVGRF